MYALNTRSLIHTHRLSVRLTMTLIYTIIKYMIADRIWLIHSANQSHHVFVIPIVHFSFFVGCNSHPFRFVILFLIMLFYTGIDDNDNDTTFVFHIHPFGRSVFFSQARAVSHNFLLIFALISVRHLLWYAMIVQTLGATYAPTNRDTHTRTICRGGLWNWLIRCDSVFDDCE